MHSRRGCFSSGNPRRPATAATQTVNPDRRSTWTRRGDLSCLRQRWLQYEGDRGPFQVALLPGEPHCETATIGKEQDLTPLCAFDWQEARLDPIMRALCVTPLCVTPLCAL